MRSVTTVTNKTWNPSFIPKRASEAQASQVISVIFYFLFLTAFSLFFSLCPFSYLFSLPPSLPSSALCPVCDIHEVWVSTLLDICGTHLERTLEIDGVPKMCKRFGSIKEALLFPFLVLSFFFMSDQMGQIFFHTLLRSSFHTFLNHRFPNPQISQHVMEPQIVRGKSDNEPNTHALVMNVDVIHYLTSITYSSIPFVKCLLGDNETLPD